MPADPAAVPPPVPEWIAKALGYETTADFNECYLRNSYYEVPKRELVCLLASVRKGALREAADVCGVVGSGMSGSNAYDWGAEDCATAILALIDQPPAKESRSDDRESAKRGEAV